MIKKLLYVALSALLFVSCKKTIELNTISNPPLIQKSVIDSLIRNDVNLNHSFNWKNVNDEIVWSALQQSDHVLSIGYRPKNIEVTAENIANIDINNNEWKLAKEEVSRIILKCEGATQKNLTIENIELWQENTLPVMDVMVFNFETVKALRASPFVRYAEPLGYEPKQLSGIQQSMSSSGCGSNVPNPALQLGVDYTNIIPNSKQSWNYVYHGIPAAWTKSTGKNIKVFIIDTGCELDQENLGNAFNQGYSSGRTIEKIVTLPQSTFLGIATGPIETSDDGCGHGTSMAGVCAAPRGIDGAVCGVAYNCNLVTSRAAEDVYIDESREAKGVADAFTNAAKRTDVKIISMSMGRITSSSQITDAINYAYGKEKLIFCAAGTSFGWTSGWFGVLFPASLPNVNAVTGVRDNNYNNTCTDCHEGTETDFTVVMEKASDESHPITLATTGDIPSTIGGSSVSTATMAGMAALVWAKFPAYTRDQILSKLIMNSYNYPTKNSNVGWGNLNVNNATN